MLRRHLLIFLTLISSTGYGFFARGVDFDHENAEIKINGSWHTLSCQANRCDLDNKAQVFFAPTEDGFSVSVRAKKQIRLNGLRLKAAIALSGERYFLSEGFQSWSNSGWLKIGESLDYKRIYKDLRGDDENRTGVGYSYNYTMLSNREDHFFIGVEKSTKFQSWMTVVSSTKDLVELTLMMGDVGEDLLLEVGQEYSLDPWFVDAGSDAKTIFNNYAAKLKSFKKTRFKKAKVGWNSWYEMWSNVSIEGINAHIDIATDYLNALFTEASLETPEITLVIDDGWEMIWGDWYFKDSFADSIEETLLKMKEKNIEPGIWVAPFLASPSSELYKDHPDWFVEGATYKHPTGTYQIIDLTHPEALGFIKTSMKRLVAMGFEKIKIDFLMTATYPGKRYLNKTGLEAYEMGMKAIRDAVGGDVYLLACGAPSLASIPYVDAWRQGADIAFQFPTDYVGPSWTDVVDQLRNLSARWFICNVTSCDLDPWLMRKPTSQQAALASAWVVALGGGGFYLSDDMRKLDQKRLNWKLPSALLQQSVSGRAAHPSGVVPKEISSYLRSASTLDRIFKRNRIVAPQSWQLPNMEKIEFDLVKKSLR